MSFADEAFGGQHGNGTRNGSAYPQVRLVAVMALRSHLLATVYFGEHAAGEARGVAVAVEAGAQFRVGFVLATQGAEAEAEGLFDGGAGHGFEGAAAGEAQVVSGGGRGAAFFLPQRPRALVAGDAEHDGGVAAAETAVAPGAPGVFALFDVAFDHAHAGGASVAAHLAA